MVQAGLDKYGSRHILLNAMATVVDGDFEWDESKAASNLANHGVSFPEAATVFADLPLSTSMTAQVQTEW